MQRATTSSRWAVLSLAAAASLSLAAASLEEALQSLSSRRSADLTDVGCDLAGLVIFVWLAGRLGTATLPPLPRTGKPV